MIEGGVSGEFLYNHDKIRISKEKVTNGSTAAVKSDMERFCPDFQKVKQGLQQYGISLTDKKLCPPDEKYVRFVDVNKTASNDRRITARNRKRILYNE